MKKTLLFICTLTTLSLFSQDPVILNPTFDKITKAGGSDCSCSGWRNTDLVAEGESTTSDSKFPDDGGIIKYDGREADGAYQEFAVLANTTYKVKFNIAFKDDSDYDASIDSSFELRVLKGSAYDSGYTINYGTDATTTEKNGYGYTDMNNVIVAANNIHVLTVDRPVEGGSTNGDLQEKEFTFNTGSETSVAIFMRGLGRSAAPVDDKPSGISWSNGDQEIRVGFVEVTKEGVASVDSFFSSQVSVYPNPANEFVKISSSVDINRVEIYNLIGKKVISTSKITNNNLDVSSLSKGVYLMKLTSGESVASRKLIKN